MDILHNNMDILHNTRHHSMGRIPILIPIPSHHRTIHYPSLGFHTNRDYHTLRGDPSPGHLRHANDRRRRRRDGLVQLSLSFVGRLHLRH